MFEMFWILDEKCKKYENERDWEMKNIKSLGGKKGLENETI